MTDAFPPDMAGGVGRVALTQSQALRRLGYEVQVLSTRRDDSQPAESSVAGIPVRRLKVSYPLRWQAYLSLYNPIVARKLDLILDQLSPDVVHAHNVHAYLTYHSLTLAKRRGLPVVLTAHDVMTVAYQKLDNFVDPAQRDIPDSFDYRISLRYHLRKQRFRYFPLRNAAIRRVLRRSVDAIISPSRALLDVLAMNRVSARRMVCLPNGVDSSAFVTSEHEQAAFRARFGLIDHLVILLAGRINAAKGIFQLLEALREIVRQVPHAVLMLLAPFEHPSGPLLAVAESLGIRQYIRSVGWLSGRDLATAFGVADVCVTPSIVFDSFPTVNLEAMAAGTPVVATCFGGSREIVVDGETGFIVNPFNIEMLAERVTRLLANKTLRDAMGRRAHERIRAHYDWMDNARQIVEIYRLVSQPDD
jgi:glycosyltransferase involved in cell wall biosynthesis